MEYAIGLDIGIASVGWAIVALDENEHPCGIIRMGSRIFEKAEHPKTGASLAAPRREARSARRRLRRHRHRNERIRYMLIRRNILIQEQLDHLFEGRLEDIYALRVRALDEPLTVEEFARILIHLSQRRGFRSNALCAGLALLVYEIAVWGTGIFLSLTYWSRFGVFFLTWLLSAAVMLALYPLVCRIQKIGGETWRE